MEIIVVGTGLSIVVWIFANSRGCSGFGWFCLSMVISPLVAGLLVLVLPNRKKPAYYFTTPNNPFTHGQLIGEVTPPPAGDRFNRREPML